MFHLCRSECGEQFCKQHYCVWIGGKKYALCVSAVKDKVQLTLGQIFAY